MHLRDWTSDFPEKKEDCRESFGGLRLIASTRNGSVLLWE
jgi:hypothetical protein